MKVIHNPDTVGMAMSLDQTFFITIATLKIAEMDEAQLALLISHELAHYLMDHQVNRLGHAILQKQFKPYYDKITGR